MPGYPACFQSKAAFESYQVAAAESGRTDIENGYCFDCTPTFKKAAEDRGLCRHPEVVFVGIPDEDGELVTHGIRGDFEWYGTESEA